MFSAFGVDHGEISKGTWWRPGAKGLTRAQKATQGVGLPTGPERVKGALKRAGETKVSLKGIGGAAGRGVGHVSRTAQKYPGTTGTALVGGGGYAGYRHLEDRFPKRKRKKKS